jgi:hypothetical protein
MILHYGSYVHGQNEVGITITRETWRDDTGRRRGYVETWTINGRLRATGADLVGNLTTQIAALKTGYAADGGSLTLYQDNGSTPTGHTLVSSSCWGGIKVDGPSFPSGQGAEYATYRDYTIRAVGYVEGTVADDIVSYVETIMVTGTGGQRFVHLQPLRGAPVQQITAQQTLVRVTQSGSAVGRTGYPLPPEPAGEAGSEKEDERSIGHKSPKRGADGEYREYETTWQYVFESAVPVDELLPRTWPDV